jgi:hypothetical protein
MKGQIKNMTKNEIILTTLKTFIEDRKDMKKEIKDNRDDIVELKVLSGKIGSYIKTVNGLLILIAVAIVTAYITLLLK